MSTFTAMILGALFLSVGGNIYFIRKQVTMINIKRQVQKNKQSPNNVQEYNATNNIEKKGIFKRLKKRNHEK